MPLTKGFHDVRRPQVFVAWRSCPRSLYAGSNPAPGKGRHLSPRPGRMVDLTAETVAERLRDRATRSATLTALESHAAPIPTAVSLAAAPALLGLMTMDAAEVERNTYDRAGLLVARLEAEALPDVVAVHGAAFGEGGYERLWNANSVLNAALRQPAAQLTRADARSYACHAAYETIYPARGYTEPFRAAGITGREFIGLGWSPSRSSRRRSCPTRTACRPRWRRC
eukprot:COSAG06_NODE_297_length_18026_cov_50.901545_8_plen_226_part_00